MVACLHCEHLVWKSPVEAWCVKTKARLYGVALGLECELFRKRRPDKVVDIEMTEVVL